VQDIEMLAGYNSDTWRTCAELKVVFFKCEKWPSVPGHFFLSVSVAWLKAQNVPNCKGRVCR